MPDQKSVSPAARYILMPERLLAHNNTIGLKGFLATPGHRYGIVKMSLTVCWGAHISPAPDDERGRRECFRDEARGSEDPGVAQLDGGPDRRVVCSMHCLLGKGYAGGGDHEVLRHGLFSSSLVRKFDVSWIE